MLLQFCWHVCFIPLVICGCSCLHSGCLPVYSTDNLNHSFRNEHIINAHAHTVPVDHVLTHCSILAWQADALIHINFTVHTFEPRQTFTQVHANQVTAGGSVAAGVGLTLIYFSLAVDPWWRRAESGCTDSNDGLKLLKSTSVCLFWFNNICSDESLCDNVAGECTSSSDDPT